MSADGDEVSMPVHRGAAPSHVQTNGEASAMVFTRFGQ